MKRLFELHSYPARLVLGSLILILLTTLSAGAPAYWLTRTELERLAWSHVAAAEHATHSLLQAEQERLDNMLALLVERPTLHRLLNQGTPDDIAAYLSAFQSQSDLSSLILCDPSVEAPTAPFLSSCPHPLPSGFQAIELGPAVLASRPITPNDPSAIPAIAIAGRLLDVAFLRRLAADTGVEQSVLSQDGRRLASSLAMPSASTPIEQHPVRAAFAAGGTTLSVNGRRYYAALSPLPQSGAASTLYIEAALPVDDLIVTRNRAFSILAVSTGVVALLAAIAGVWTVRRLTNPLEQLTRAAEAISGGDLEAPVPLLPGPSEVRTLAVALQSSQASMLAALDNLAQARDWLDSLIRSVVEGVATFDQAGHVTFINETAAQLAGVSVEDALDQHIDDLFAASDETGVRISLLDIPQDRSKHRAGILTHDIRGIKAARRPGERALRRVHSNAASQPEATILLEISAARLIAPGSAPPQTVLVLRDISQEESLRQLRSYFLSNITHEFRTPLSALNASMELLMSETDLTATEMRELMKPVHLSLVSLQTLIDNLLESSSIEAGRFFLRQAPVDLNHVIANAAQLVQPFLERRDQSLAISEPTFLPRLTGDAARLTQVLVNLLTNASKFSPMHSVINLNVERKSAALRVSVIDQGPGIPPEERDRIFRRFVRGEDGSEQAGVGLGLHVVKTAVDLHGGQVGVEQHAGGGSVFWFELPVEPEETAA
jgi:signal transduction histidine kinase/HAMP domain-containing protein